MKLPDFTLIEQVTIQARLIRTVAIGGEEWHPEQLWAILNAIALNPDGSEIGRDKIRWYMSEHCFRSLVSQNVLEYVEAEDYIKPGADITTFMDRLKKFEADNPSKPLPNQTTSYEEYLKLFPPKKKLRAAPAQGNLFHEA